MDLGRTSPSGRTHLEPLFLRVHSEETGSSTNHAKQRACSSVQTKIAQRKQKAGHPHNTLSLPLTHTPTYCTYTHTHTHTHTHTWSCLNKEIDCARPIRFPREGIPDFNGINLGTLAQIIKNSVFYGLSWGITTTEARLKHTAPGEKTYTLFVWKHVSRQVFSSKVSEGAANVLSRKTPPLAVCLNPEYTASFMLTSNTLLAFINM